MLIEPEPPTIEGGCNDQTISVGEIFRCSPVFSDPNLDDVFEVRVNYGENPNLFSLPQVHPLLDEDTHVVFIENIYNTAGTFTVTLSVDDETFTVDREYTVTVLAAPEPDAPPTLFHQLNGDLLSGPQLTDLSGIEGEPVERTFVLRDPDPSHTAWFVAINWNSNPGDDSRDEVDLFHIERTDGSASDVEFVATHIYQSEGTFDFKKNAVHDPDKNGLNNENNERSELYFFTVNIASNNVAPTFDAFDTTPAVLNEGQTLVRANQSFSDPDSDDSWVATVDYGDGSPVLVLDLNGTTFSLNHVYQDDAGSPYIVTVIVNDGTSIPAQIAFPVTVNNVPPTGVIGNSGPVIEGDSATVSISNPNDPSPVDTAAGFTYSYDFGNTGAFDISGSPENVATVTGSLLNDGPATIPVRVQITDKDGGASEYTTDIIVNNAAPAIDTVTGSTIDENGTATVSGAFTDASSDDSFTVTIDWGQGAPITYDYAAGSTSFSEQRQYLDDNPTGESGRVYPIAVQIVDDDGGTANAATDVTVNNLSPVASIDVVRDALTGKSLTYIDRDGALVPGEINVALAGSTIEVVGGYSDVGTLDTHTASVAWDDGTEEPVGITTLGETDVASHVYALVGDYRIDLTISDDDTDSDTPMATVSVVGATEASAGFGRRSLRSVAIRS